jgi:hypothetical protein
MTTIAELGSFLSRETAAVGSVHGLSSPPLTPAGGSEPVAAASGAVAGVDRG